MTGVFQAHRKLEGQLLLGPGLQLELPARPAKRRTQHARADGSLGCSSNHLLYGSWRCTTLFRRSWCSPVALENPYVRFSVVGDASRCGARPQSALSYEMPRAITGGVVGWHLGRVKTFLSNPAISNSGIAEEKGRRGGRR